MRSGVGAICDAIEAIAARQQRVALGAAPADAPLLGRGRGDRRWWTSTSRRAEARPGAVATTSSQRFSALPYSLARSPGLHMVTPVLWNELGEVDNGTYVARTSATRLEPDVFAEVSGGDPGAAVFGRSMTLRASFNLAGRA